MKKNAIALLTIALAGCGGDLPGSSGTTCSDAEGTTLATSLISKAAEGALRDEKDESGAVFFDQAAIRAQMATLKVSFADIRTDKKDPNSTKVFCKATANVSLPPDRLSSIDEALKGIEQGDLNALASRLDLARNANVFSAEVSYTLQPTDDEKSIYAEVPESHTVPEFMRWVAGAQLVADRRAAVASQSVASKAMETEQAAAAADAPEATAFDASFKCSDASNTMERAICSDKELADLDKNLASQYSAVRDAYPNEDIRSLQRDWLENTRDSCTDYDCLVKVYKERIDFLSGSYPTPD